MNRLLLTALIAAPLCAAQPITVEIAQPLAADGVVLAEVTVGIRGDTPPLAWDRSLPLADEDGDGVYTATLDFPLGTGLVEYKAVAALPSGELVWEPGDNRVLLPGRMGVDRRAFGGTQTGLPEQTVSAAHLSEDLGLLRHAIETLHPGLLLHASEAALDRAAERMMRQARTLGARHGEAIPVSDSYLIVAEALGALRDGHTQINPFNQSGYTRASLFARPDRVPFAFRLLDRRMVVTGDATAGGVLPIGTEILTLDGRSVAEVVETLLPYVRGDGGNDGKRLDLLGVSGLEPAADFDILYSLRFPAQGDLLVTARLPNGTEAALPVSRLTAEARRERLLARDATLPRSYDDALAFRFLDEAPNTAYLRVGSLVTYKMETDFRAWLVAAFREMAARDAEHLIVDLRGNEGGLDDAAAMLFRHLIGRPVEVERWGSVTAYDRVPEALRPHVRSWNSDFLDISTRVTPDTAGRFVMSAPQTVTVSPAPDAFGGPVYALVDAAASSATFYLARQLQQAGAAVLVGQETGGSLKGLNGGQVAFLTLPHTGLVVDIPLIGARPPLPGPDRGILPDVPVAVTAEAVRAGRDPALEAALSLIRSD